MVSAPCLSIPQGSRQSIREKYGNIRVLDLSGRNTEFLFLGLKAAAFSKPAFWSHADLADKADFFRSL
jgi:hypothetical protein